MAPDAIRILAAGTTRMRLIDMMRIRTAAHGQEGTETVSITERALAGTRGTLTTKVGRGDKRIKRTDGAAVATSQLLAMAQFRNEGSECSVATLGTVLRRTGQTRVLSGLQLTNERKLTVAGGTEIRTGTKRGTNGMDTSTKSEDVLTTVGPKIERLVGLTGTLGGQ